MTHDGSAAADGLAAASGLADWARTPGAEPDDRDAAAPIAAEQDQRLAPAEHVADRSVVIVDVDMPGATALLMMAPCDGAPTGLCRADGVSAR